MTRRIGADPELFAVDGNGKFKSVIGILQGTKEHPFEIRPDGCAVQVDNVAAEFNIPPSTSAEQFIEAINFNLNYITRVLEAHECKPAIVASAEFSSDELADPAAQVFGCDPDFNAWTGRKNPRPMSRNRALRVSGGHIHIETKLDPFYVARCFDLWVVVPSLALDRDVRRRELYGKAGACRPKPYGVECRALSNFWLASDDLKKWVYDQTHLAVDFAEQGYKFSKEEGEKIQSCINNSNMGLMQELVAEYGIG